MRKIHVFILTMFIAGFVLSGCSKETGPVPEINGTPAVVSLDGTYTAEAFEAKVENGIIDINLVDGDTKSLYWKGTFEGRSDVKSITSRADTGALENSITGSLDDEKVFKLDDGKLVFDFSMMGTTKTVKLAKQ